MNLTRICFGNFSSKLQITSFNEKISIVNPFVLHLDVRDIQVNNESTLGRLDISWVMQNRCTLET